MIYQYRYLTGHRIEGLHQHVSEFFVRLFATKQTNVQQLVDSDFWQQIKSSGKLTTYLQTLAEQYVALPAAAQIAVEQAFRSNNELEQLCEGHLDPVSYKKLESELVAAQADGAFVVVLKKFFMDLWEDYPQTVAIERAYGTVKDHFDDFTRADLTDTLPDQLICPFCNLNLLKASEGKGRDAYDHFMPKALYPFNSVNFKNLVPTCHECNSDEKRDIDVPYRPNGTRRVMIYPYRQPTSTSAIEATIQVHQNPVGGSLPQFLRDPLNAIHWTVSLKRAGEATCADELRGWIDVYGVDRRYHERIRQFARQWWDDFVRHYKTCGTTNFNVIKTDWLARLDSPNTQPMVLIKHSYYRALFATHDLQKLLDMTIQK